LTRGDALVSGHVEASVAPHPSAHRAARASGVIAIIGRTPDSLFKASASCGSIDGRQLRDLPRRRAR